MRRLIYDIGANDGSDTEFYLSKGFDVVAVEADPALATALSKRFANQIAKGRLTVLNVGIAEGSGVLPFYVNAKDDWSSFMKNGKATQTNTFETIEVRTCTLADVISEHGDAYYIKLDIEGFERVAVASLSDSAHQAPYVSFERNGDLEDVVRLLGDLGYDSFQLVRQGEGVLAAPPFPSREGRYRRVAFTGLHSGCFGRDLRGTWSDGPGVLDQLARDEADLLHNRDRVAARAVWYDIHARHRDARPPSGKLASLWSGRGIH